MQGPQTFRPVRGTPGNKKDTSRRLMISLPTKDYERLARLAAQLNIPASVVARRLTIGGLNEAET